MQVSRRNFLSSAAGAGLFSAVSAAQQTRQAQALDTPIPLAELPTPALLVDSVAFERNINTMAAHLKDRKVGLRPHAKTHKCATVAKRQLSAGAIGICCAKVSEAEALAAEGVGPILITSPLATLDKTRRVAHLAATYPDTWLVVDCERGAELIAQAAKEAGAQVGVLVDLDVGTRRTGVQPGEPALALTRLIAQKPELKLHGVQAYAGHLMHVNGYDARRQRSQEALKLAADTRTAIEAAGIPCPIFTGGGTGTFDIDVDVPGITDLQCGSYPFMDVQYRIIGGPDSELLDAFEPALFVWSTAISQPVAGRITVDAGYKALTNENVAPQLLDYAGTTYDWGGDEHGIVSYEGDAAPFALGDKVKIFVAHCDPTVNLYNVYHVVSDGQVVEVWPVTARGCSA